MATLNISIPDSMRSWINSQIESGEYTSASDYLRDLVRNDQRTKLDRLLLEGINSGPSVSLDMKAIRTKAMQRLKDEKKPAQ